MTIFFDRNLVVNIDLSDGQNVEITEPRISFDIRYSATDTPTDGEITIFDVAASTAEAIQSASQSVRMFGGYQQSLGLIFDGVVRRVEHQREGLERQTRILLGGKTIIPPGETRSNRLANFNTAGEEVDLKTAIASVVEQMGLTLGDTSLIPDYRDEALYAGGIDGGVVLTQWLRTPHGIEWYEEKGVVKFSRRRAPAERTSAVEISEETGMVGTPALEFDDDGGESVMVKTLLNPAIELGTTINVKSEIIEGAYKVVELSHTGDNWRKDRFNSEMQGVPIQ